MSLPSISIITPSYNQGHYLEQTIESVLSQGYPKLEYMIIDGGSTDNSVKIIKKYEKHLAFWISEKDEGQSDAINKGLQKATGEVVNWLNSDDYYQPDTLQKVGVAFMNPETLIVSGQGRVFDDSGSTRHYTKGVDVYSDNLAKTIGWARMDQPETFFRHDVIRHIGLLDTRLHYLMDRDWWIKYLFSYGLNGIVQIPDVLVNFRLHQNSKTVSQNAAFQVEHDSFFYALANQFGFTEEKELIEKCFSVKKDFQIQIVDNYSAELVKHALQYYLLFRADESYAAFSNGKARLLLSTINHQLLTDTERGLLRKLKLRTTEPFATFLSLIRKLRSA
ncbi:glycosyltransferase family 2 protein [Cytophagaceae bacterium YF14B1]|uniref:Glycosyltransferase family 2 protein n=1 Tax=Xanthocytophaga flava TaxID=3048013 RepID=A0AAE3QMY8_9BACT|nr:glycosyltransferase family 2 protein [Xanthocytophaga flavus]MDJ1480395.1 glycosyltransferase family 2 protein [Xanthocytophaga flavus]